jgi:hypothetical protein
MSDEEPSVLRFDANRDSADLDERVRCSRCGKLIFMHATRCGRCGLHVSGRGLGGFGVDSGFGGVGFSGDAVVVGGGDCGCAADCDCARVPLNFGSANVGEARLSFAATVRYRINGRSCLRCRLLYTHCEFAPCSWSGTS